MVGGQLLLLPALSGLVRWETLLLLMHKEMWRAMGFPLESMGGFVIVSLLPSPGPSFLTLPLLLPPPPRRKTKAHYLGQRLGSFIVHHHQHWVHVECLPFIHNLAPCFPDSLMTVLQAKSARFLSVTITRQLLINCLTELQFLIILSCFVLSGRLHFHFGKD